MNPLVTLQVENVKAFLRECISKRRVEFIQSRLGDFAVDDQVSVLHLEPVSLNSVVVDVDELKGVGCSNTLIEEITMASLIVESSFE